MPAEAGIHDLPGHQSTEGVDGGPAAAMTMLEGQCVIVPAGCRAIRWRRDRLSRQCLPVTPGSAFPSLRAVPSRHSRQCVPVMPGSAFPSLRTVRSRHAGGGRHPRLSEPATTEGVDGDRHDGAARPMRHRSGQVGSNQVRHRRPPRTPPPTLPGLSGGRARQPIRPPPSPHSHGQEPAGARPRLRGHAHGRGG